MLKFTAESSRGPLFGFGLTKDNLDELIKGLPINIDLADQGGPPINVLLMFANDEKALMERLQEAGLVDPETTTIGECQCAKCTARRTMEAMMRGAAVPDELAFQGAVKVDRETGEESSVGFDNLDPEFVPALAAGFIVGWFRMPANEERLDEVLALLSPALAAEQQVAILQDHILQFEDVIPGAATLAKQGHCLAEADWEMVAEALGNMAERREGKERMS